MRQLTGVIGRKKAELDTPSLLVDLDVMEGNIRRIAGTCRRHGIAWRPHMKGQKVPLIVHKELAAGAIGVTCAKISEAEVMAGAGIGDILIANQIVGAQKITRLTALRRHVDVMVAIDDASNAAELAAAARDRGVTLRVVIEHEIGIRRSGVQPGEAAVALAREVAGLDVVTKHVVQPLDGVSCGIRLRRDLARPRRPPTPPCDSRRSRRARRR